MPNMGNNINRCTNVENMIDNQGYLYHVGKRKQGNIRNLICSQKGGMDCNATAIMQDDGTIVQKKPHVHVPDPMERDTALFWNGLFKRRSHSFASSRSVFEQEIRKFPNLVQHIRWNDVKTRMEFWKSKLNPPPIVGFLDLQNITQTPEWRELLFHSKGLVKLSSLTASDGQQCIIYGDIQFCRRFNEVDSLDMSTSSLVIPDIGGTQVVMLITANYNKHSMTFGYALLNNVTRALCREVMRFIKREFFPHIIVEKITTNYDWMVKAAVQEVWPNARVASHFYSFCLCVLKKADDEPLINILRDEHIKIIIKMICIALEPPANIIQSFNTLHQSVQASQFGNAFMTLFRWFEKIIHGLTPEVFSFYLRDDLMTSIPMRTARKFSNRVNSDNQTVEFWYFYDKSLKVIESSCKDFSTILTRDVRAIKNITMSPKIKPLLRKCMSNVRRLQSMLVNNVISNERFLAVGLALVSSSINLMLNQKVFKGISQIPVDPDIQLNIIQQAPVVQLMLEQQLLVENNIQDILQLNNEEQIENPEELQQVEDNIENIAVVQNQNPDNVDGDVDPDNNHEDVNPWNFTCLRCKNQDIDMISRPCNCVCICYDCSLAVRAAPRNLVCPSCDDNVVNFEKVYLPPSNTPRERYDWHCQICYTHAITHIGQCCNHLQICSKCVEHLEEQNREHPNRYPLCPFCNISGGMTKVTFLENRNNESSSDSSSDSDSDSSSDDDDDDDDNDNDNDNDNDDDDDHDDHAAE